MSRHEGRHIFKFADDSVIVSLLSNQETDHGPVVEDFIEWCKRSFLEINVSKTKEMSIDFRKQPPSIRPSIINGQAVDTVKSV